MQVTPLSDAYGRVAKDLRVSLTDKCNLRCTYCMPEEGLDWLSNDKLLSDDEIVRLVQVAVQRLGVDEVRFTGGEPLVRRGHRRHRRPHARASTPTLELSVTSNGSGTCSHRSSAGRRRPQPGQHLARHSSP